MWRHSLRLVLVSLVLALSLSPALWAQEEEREEFRVEVRSGPGEPHMVWIGTPDGRGFVGIHLLDLTPELRVHFGVPEEAGVMLSKVEDSSPAQRAGLLVGDIVTSVDGEQVDTSVDVSRLIRKKEAGEVAQFEVWRGGRPDTLSVEVAERERKVLDITPRIFLPLEGRRLRMRSPGEEAQVHIETAEGTREALHHLQRYFQSPEWAERLERLQNLNINRVEDRMKEVERKLKDLEQELEKLGAKGANR